ncbi:spore coat protein [Romboutsia maritimum]|uniref:Spore coat protein n=1 Tax=Romboutsia maritimum TaxID=2020948 RepID=A0A371IT57_9FIRM|nr:spore coat protein [Romboutsia maritimum]RDY23662.1 spore coat protein [Romboutsia maritimum]
MINLSTKEKFLLEDEKEQEKLCVEKYKDFAQKAQDSQLSDLFSQLSQKEQQHYDSICQLLNGTMPNINQQQNQGIQQVNNTSIDKPNLNLENVNSQIGQNNSYNEHDKMLCIDSLSTEKYVSSTYNTAVFEFRDKNIRQILNHIQKEEQEHGEKIFNYMSNHGMYQVK